MGISLCFQLLNVNKVTSSPITLQHEFSKSVTAHHLSIEQTSKDVLEKKSGNMVKFFKKDASFFSRHFPNYSLHKICFYTYIYVYICIYIIYMYIIYIYIYIMSI